MYRIFRMEGCAGNLSHGVLYVVNVKDTPNDRNTELLYQHFMWFQQEIKTLPICPAHFGLFTIPGNSNFFPVCIRLGCKLIVISFTDRTKIIIVYENNNYFSN